MRDDDIGGLQVAFHAIEATLLGRPATLEDVGDAAAWAASDRARTMTAATINVSTGALLD